MTETHAPPGAYIRFLDRNDEAPRKARAFAAEIFGTWGITDDYAMRLVVSELVTNACRHGEGTISVRLFLGEYDGCPVVEVGDQGNGRPVILPENYAATSGRGLFTIEALVLEWGVRDRDDGGKVIWARLAV